MKIDKEFLKIKAMRDAGKIDDWDRLAMVARQFDTQIDELRDVAIIGEKRPKRRRSLVKKIRKLVKDASTFMVQIEDAADKATEAVL